MAALHWIGWQESPEYAVVTNALDMRLDLCTLLRETRVFTTGRFEHLLSVFRAHRCL